MEGQRIRPLNTDPLLGHPKYMKVMDAIHAPVAEWKDSRGNTMSFDIFPEASC